MIRSKNRKNGEMMIERLREMLMQIQFRAGSEFSGAGIIVCDTPESLPICPIRSSSTGPPGGTIVDRLVAVSSIHSEFHDGFHVISSDWELTLVAQYFSPPIVENLEIDRTKRFGGRYLAALFGSALPCVSAAGIISNGFGLAIFQHGTEIYFKAAS